MRSYLFLLLNLAMSIGVYAQQIELEVTQTGILKSVNFYHNSEGDQLLIRLSATGEVSVVPVNVAEFEYYTSYELPEKKGKIAKIGHTEIDYHVTFKTSPLNGKIASIGRLRIDYFDEYATDEKTGKVSGIVGLASVGYHRTFKNDGNYGKLAKINDHEVRFYDDRIRMGKIARFGPLQFNYYEFNHDSATRGNIRSVSGRSSGITVRIVDMGE